MSEIATRPAGASGIDTKGEPGDGGTVTVQRIRHVTAFIGERLAGPVLDIGPANDFGRLMKQHYGMEIVNTDGDLDFDRWQPLRPAPPDGFDAVFAFEVIEHLLNPLLFLVRLRQHCGPRTRIFITYPRRPRLFWPDFHWHEMDRRRFRYLTEQAGYEIVQYREVTLWREWSFFFTGLRPFLRLTVGRLRTQIYELRMR